MTTVALVLGAMAARQGTAPYLVAALLTILVTAFLFADHIFPVLVGWVAVEGVVYPFLRYPLYHNVATFDRYVVLALGGALVLRTWPRMTTASRRLAMAAGVFCIVYGLRAVLTKALPVPPNYGLGSIAVNRYQPQADWLDGVAIPFLVMLAAARTVTAKRWETVAKAMTFLGVTVAALGLAEWLLGFHLAPFSHFTPFIDERAGVVRVEGPYGDPSTYGGVLVVCLAATAYYMQANKAYRLGGVALLVEILGIAPSFTKTIWGAGFVTLVIALGFRARGHSRTIRVALSGAVVLGIVYTLVQNTHVIAERVRGSNGNVLARLGDYEQGLLIFQHWPWFGAGINQFISAQQFVRQVYVGGVQATPSAHNTFISVLAELGLVGFVPLAFLGAAIVGVILTLRRRATTRREVLFTATVLAAVVGYVLVSLTLVEIYYPPSTTFLALILGAAAARLNILASGQNSSALRYSVTRVRAGLPLASGHARE